MYTGQEFRLRAFREASGKKAREKGLKVELLKACVLGVSTFFFEGGRWGWRVRMNLFVFGRRV